MNTDSELSRCGYGSGVAAGTDGFGVAVHVDDLTPDQARSAGRSLCELADKLTPATQDAHWPFAVALDAINDARGTSHTIESVAGSLGTDPANACKADATRMAQHVGGG